MSKPDTQTPRGRYRAQVREEVKRHAWEQIAAAGASALSLNAIAKQMGMSGPALYRYFASRDELITELIRDAYRSLADTFRARARADAGSKAGAGADLGDLAHALRGWALDDPQRYFLIYGTPVPGYRAPEDTTRTASEIMAVILDACAAAPAGSPGSPASPAEKLPTTHPSPFDAHLDAHRAWAGPHPAPSSALHRALLFWTRLHGVLSLELAGHFAGMGFDPAQLYTAEAEAVMGR
ncbi:TetR/AcrR family transcriptional regulator [Actinacidiphila acididurans]|uniref:TetR/AcrR family transcriptional regulator n=1 Tax=Actinacidiphila acididurans TaxID=2784346 RepID=A0ABS2TZY1_9ACTN|nr:TetR/AcrR family transcriptional regulator [Actinacidiphila acididurans]MBM9507845.1 TetR/AcrR family transcriptional regulator [Actinacidiphila acididurans]